MVERMRAGAIESTRIVRNPLDVLAQQIVAMCAVDEWAVDDARHRWCGGAANFAELGDDSFTAVLDLLAGRYPSDEFAGLRPRIVWDRLRGTLRARDGAGADRDHQRRHHPRPRPVRRVPPRRHARRRARRGDGLREPAGRDVRARREHVADRPDHARPGHRPPGAGRAGEDAVLARRPARAPDRAGSGDRRVHPRPAPPRPPTTPSPTSGPRPRSTSSRPATSWRTSTSRWRPPARSPTTARSSSSASPTSSATGGSACSRRSVRASTRRGAWPCATCLGERLGVDVQVLWSDDGIVLRLPDAVEHFPVEDLVLDPDRGGGPRRRRAARSSLLRCPRSERPRPERPAPAQAPARRAHARCGSSVRRRPDCSRSRPATPASRSSSRPRASASRTSSTCRRCVGVLRDLPVAQDAHGHRRHARRRRRSRSRSSTRGSPTFMYEGDAPLAERRAAALSLDRDLLRELLGTEELRELLDADALAELELELQRLTPAMHERIRTADDVVDLLRDLGDLSDAELAARVPRPVLIVLVELRETRRVVEVAIAGETRLDRRPRTRRVYRDVLGAALPPGLPAAFTESRADPLVDLVARFARTHGPFTTARHLAVRYGLGTDRLDEALQTLVDADRVVRGEFRPDGTEREWCDAGVLRRTPASEPRPPAPRGRARGTRGPGSLPARVARHGRPAPRHRRAARRADPAAGRRRPRLHAGGRRTAGSRRRLPARPARRADQQR